MLRRVLPGELILEGGVIGRILQKNKTARKTLLENPIAMRIAILS
jgi:hypothetical protein